jgi:hypothetical protein
MDTILNVENFIICSNIKHKHDFKILHVAKNN